MRDLKRFEVFRDDLRSAFPIWTKIRKDPNAIGSQFLGVMGKGIAEVEWVLQYALDQLYIETADLEQVDILYVAHLPSNLSETMNVRFSSGVHIYEIETNMMTFLEPLKVRSYHNSIGYNTKAYIDYDKKKMYVHRVFNAGELYPKGHTTMLVRDKHGTESSKHDIQLYTHHVWNFFDEFGLLLGLSRLEGERNYDYRERILDVFRRPANSTRSGLENGMGRELGLTYEMNWDNGGSELILDRSRVLVHTITVDDELLPQDMYYIDRSNRVVLKPNMAYDGEKRIVRFIAGVELHELHDSLDQAFQNELRNIDGTGTPLLQYYVDKIRDQVPIMWGQWKWNQGFWDVTDAELSGYGYIPNVYDATFSGWKKYKEE